MLSLLLLVACDGGKSEPLAVSIPFLATVDGAPFACGESYDGIGVGAATVEVLDLRFFVHDVALLTEEGDAVPVELDQDGRWQHENVALVDLEDGAGPCETGSPDTHAAVTGTAPAGDYHAVSFRLGVPAALNHLDSATAPAPLNDPALWWAWTSGYKYLRVDVATAANPTFFFHLGATDCAGDEASGYTCGTENVVDVELHEFHLGEATVGLDLADLYANSDVEALPDGEVDRVSGCMSGPADPECAPLFERLGLAFGDAQGSTQTLFTVE